MKLRTHSLALALGALTMALTPAVANAKRIYFLVGVRHVYRIGPDRDLYVNQREDIEKTYADGVASDEATYQQHVSDGADANSEAKARDGDLELLAEDRDKSLGALFDVRDDLRESHPEFRIQGDGPYQVIGVDYHIHESVMVYDDYCAYAPWPGYVVVGRPYGGWVYGTIYTPGLFVSCYHGWYSGWSASITIGFGGPLFFGGFVGHGGYIPWHGGAFAGRPAEWVHPGGGWYHAAGVREGFIGARGGFTRPAPAGWSHGAAAPGHGGSGGFNRGASTPGHAGGSGVWSHGTPGVSNHDAGGYTHSRGSFGGNSHFDSNRSTPAQGGNRGWGSSRGAAEGHADSGTGTRGGFSGHSAGASSGSSHSSGGYSHSSHSSNHSSRDHSDSHGSSHGNSHGGSSHDSHDHH